MKIEHAFLLKSFHLKCQYRYTYPVEWYERLDQINKLIERIKEGENKLSLDKAIEHGKEKRKPYYKSGRFDRTCRPNGSCSYCQRNRLHSARVREVIAEDTKEELIENVEEEI